MNFGCDLLTSLFIIAVFGPIYVVFHIGFYTVIVVERAILNVIKKTRTFFRKHDI